MDIQKTWVVENGEGHWLVKRGNVEISCDPDELEETVEELLVA